MSSSSTLNTGAAIADSYSLEKVSQLPQELQIRIFTLACRSPEPSYEASKLANRSLMAIDLKTTTSLLLASRALNAIVTPIMYANVSIDRPSVLTDFLSTIWARPSLGKLVKSLHLGPTAHLPDHWWPMTYLVGDDDRFAERHLATSLQDQALLPRWCCPLRKWPLGHASGVFSYRDLAMHNAIHNAQWLLDVSLRRPRQPWHGAELSSDEWLIRVMMAQAAIDLYLLEMRRMEDESGHEIEPWEGEPGALRGPQVSKGAKGNMVYYKRLVITEATRAQVDGTASRPEDLLKHPWYLSRASILEHLARQGSLTDHFDHPLLFARSRMGLLSFSHDGRANQSEAFGARTVALYDSNFEAVTSSPHLEVGPTRDAASVGGLLALGRSLLTLTPHIRDLYLCGIFQLLVCGSRRRELPLQSLRSLCLGPFTSHWDDSLAPTMSGADLTPLEQLRISGNHVVQHKVDSIAALPQLKEVSWDLTQCVDDERNVYATVTSLQRALDANHDATVIGEDAYSCHCTSDEDGVIDSSGSAVQRLRTVDVCMDWRAVVDDLLPDIADKEARVAWGEGRDLCRGPHRLFVTLGYGGQLPSPWIERNIGGLSERVGYLYEESKEWWERCALGLPQRTVSKLTEGDGGAMN